MGISISLPSKFSARHLTILSIYTNFQIIYFGVLQKCANVCVAGVCIKNCLLTFLVYVLAFINCTIMNFHRMIRDSWFVYRLSIEMESLVDIANENSDQNNRDANRLWFYFIILLRQVVRSWILEIKYLKYL